MENLFHVHLLTSTIFSILLAISGNEKYCSSLNSTCIKQAKERFMALDPFKLLDPPMPSYTFAIYHRDIFEKSNFKDYDSLLESRLARSHARASYLASIFEDNNNIKEGENSTFTRQQVALGGNKIRKKVPKTTGTYYANGEYVASFLLGSNEVKSFLLIDSGSDLLWWQCGPCEAKCYKQKQPLYYSTTSKTFRKVDCFVKPSSCMIKDPTLHCDQNSHECIYDLNYSDGSRTQGILADDVITFVLDHRPVRVTFGCARDQMGLRNFSATYSGVVGLGRSVGPRKVGGYSLPSQFRSNLFSMCLPSFYSREGSTINFHKTIWPRATSAKILPNYRYPTLYFLDLYKVHINDREIPLSSSWWKFKGDMSGGVVLDTGTTFTHFPHDFYIIFRYIFRSEVRDIPMVEYPVGSFDTCYKDDPNGRDLYFPVVKLYFGSINRRTMLLLALNRVVVHYRGHYCLAFIGWKSDISILGNNQLQGVGLTFDTNANTLSFDIDACN